MLLTVVVGVLSLFVVATTTQTVLVPPNHSVVIWGDLLFVWGCVTNACLCVCNSVSCVVDINDNCVQCVWFPT